MPFTFAHPAIILPLVRKHYRMLSATGLIAGSIAPDFESFVGLTDVKAYSHSWPGMFWYDLPMGVAIAIVFHVVVRDQLIAHLPWALQQRFGRYMRMKWTAYFSHHFFKVCISLLIGIFSHLLWDAFTHLNLLHPDSIHSHIMLGRVRLYIVIQYACSVLGLAVVGWYIYKMPCDMDPVNNKGKFTYWLYVALVMIFMLVFIRTYVYTDMQLVDVILFIDLCISSFLAALVMVSFAAQFIVPEHTRQV